MEADQSFINTDALNDWCNKHGDAILSNKPDNVYTIDVIGIPSRDMPSLPNDTYMSIYYAVDMMGHVMAPCCYMDKTSATEMPVTVVASHLHTYLNNIKEFICNNSVVIVESWLYCKLETSISALKGLGEVLTELKSNKVHVLECSRII